MRTSGPFPSEKFQNCSLGAPLGILKNGAICATGCLGKHCASRKYHFPLKVLHEGKFSLGQWLNATICPQLHSHRRSACFVSFKFIRAYGIYRMYRMIFVICFKKQTKEPITTHLRDEKYHMSHVFILVN